MGVENKFCALTGGTLRTLLPGEFASNVYDSDIYFARGGGGSHRVGSGGVQEFGFLQDSRGGGVERY